MRPEIEGIIDIIKAAIEKKAIGIMNNHIAVLRSELLPGSEVTIIIRAPIDLPECSDKVEFICSSDSDLKGLLDFITEAVNKQAVSDDEAKQSATQPKRSTVQGSETIH